MEIIKIANKGPKMDTTEKYNAYIANQNGIQLNSTCARAHTQNRNPIFDTLCKHHQTEYPSNTPLHHPPTSRH
jgi:hypothetical protein